MAFRIKDNPAAKDIELDEAIEAIAEMQEEAKKINKKLAELKKPVKEYLRSNNLRKYETPSGHSASLAEVAQETLDKHAIRALLTKEQYAEVSQVKTSDRFTVK